MAFEICAGDNPDIGEGKKLACLQDPGRPLGIRWRLIRSIRFRGPILKNWEWQPGAVKMVLTERPDAVICHGFFCLSNWLLRIICKLRGIPVIEWTQGLKRPVNSFHWFIINLYYRWADAFLFYGNFARDFFIQRGYQPDRLFVVYNSLDYDKQKAIRESITAEQIQQCRIECGAASPDDRLIVNSNRLEKGKNIDQLIKAVAMLKRQGRGVYLTLVGDGLEKPTLQQLTRELDIEDRVNFYGACYEEEKLGLLFLAADLCVMPGPVGLIAMHSLVYGTPLLTCENTLGKHGPEIETIVDGKTGHFFRDGDVQELVVKIEYMLYPAPCKSQMSPACMETIDRNYTPKNQEKVVIEALNSVLPPDKQIMNFI
jgi:glycosyltransferase involved in cell wall biosynthesis